MKKKLTTYQGSTSSRGFRKISKNGRVTWFLFFEGGGEKIEIRSTHEEMLKVIAREPEIQTIFGIPDSMLLPQLDEVVANFSSLV
jgi:hypothetical protein